MGGIVSSAVKALALDEEEKEPEKRPIVPGEVEKSIVLARSNLLRNQKKAALNLHRLASDSDHIRHLIVQEGGVVPLINMYKCKSSEVQEYCLRALGEVLHTNFRSLECIRIVFAPFCDLKYAFHSCADQKSAESESSRTVDGSP